MFILAPLDPGGIVIAGETKYRGPKGRVLRPEWLKIEYERPIAGGGVLGKGQLAPSPPARESRGVL